MDDLNQGPVTLWCCLAYIYMYAWVTSRRWKRGHRSLETVAMGFW